MKDNSVPPSIPDPDFLAQETADCPYPAYAQLREHAPVWQDPRTGQWWITRREDVEYVLGNPQIFRSSIGGSARNSEAIQPATSDRNAEADMAARLQAKERYALDGWVPTSTLQGRDGEEHKALRQFLMRFFRPSAIKELDERILETASRLVANALDQKDVDWIAAVSVPFPLHVVGSYLGIPEADLPMIRTWTTAWVQRMGLAQTSEDYLRSIELEIEGQHYFQRLFDRLRAHPDDSVLSSLVNEPVPGWGRPMTDEELHSEMFADIFVAGAETTTNAVTEGTRMLAEQPDLWEKLAADPDAQLPAFIEEVLRLESPVQGLVRECSEDVRLHGTTIPAGSVVHVRFGSCGRDPSADASTSVEMDLGRKRPRDHLAFGKGIHYCVGAPLARRELYWHFWALLSLSASLRLTKVVEGPVFHRNYYLRARKELWVVGEVRM